MNSPVIKIRTGPATKQQLKLRNRIWKAIENAGPMRFANGVWELVGTEEAGLDLPSLKNASDSYQVDIGVDPVKLPPYCITASSAQELADILDAYLAINHEHLSAAERTQEIQHEAEHGQAAMLLGAKSTTYYLEIHKSEDGDRLGWRLAHCSQGLVTTKLGLAILNVYPREPSDGDLRQLKLLGYPSIAQVAKLAAHHSLPIPLSAK
jgi:hypothetical protein